MFRSQPQAFVALPREAADSELRRYIEATLERYGVAATVPPGATDTSASPAVQEVLRDTDFVIADITGANPNVMIEVGMALGMGKRLLLLSQSRSGDLPVDLAAQQVAVYRPDDVESVMKYLDLWLRDAVSERESARA